MKKLLVILALCMVCSLVLVACDNGAQNNEGTTEAPATDAPTTEAPTTEEPTTEAPTTEEPTTEAPTTEEPTTEAPTTEAPTTEEQPPEPVKVVAGFSFDAMGNVYGTEIDMANLYFASSTEYANWGKVANIDHRVDCLKVAGWVAFFTETAGVIGYSIDNATAVYPADFTIASGQDVIDHIAAGNVPGAKTSANMFSDIPVADLEAGEHTITLFAKDPDGNEESFAEFKLVKVDNSLKVDLHTVGISGSYPEAWAGNGLPTTPALNASDAMIVMHYGSINLGELDLSKYTKVVVTYGTVVDLDSSTNYAGEYAATAQRVMLLNTASAVQEGTAFEYLPADGAIIASEHYEMSEGNLLLREVEIDLTEVDYNGQTYLTFDFRNSANEFGALAYLMVVTAIVFE